MFIIMFPVSTCRSTFSPFLVPYTVNRVSKVRERSVSKKVLEGAQVVRPSRDVGHQVIINTFELMYPHWIIIQSEVEERERTSTPLPTSTF